MTGLLFALLCLCLEAHQVTTQENNVDETLEMHEVTNGSVPITLSISLTDYLDLDVNKPICVKKGNEIDTLTVVEKYSCTVYKDCQAVYVAGYNTSGVYSIKPEGLDEMQVYCEFDDCGAWIVIQRRINGTVEFFRNWTDYKKGFGDLNGEFWLGLERIHQLTNKGYQKLKVFLANGSDTEWAAYSSFSVDSESNKYKLAVGGYSGTAGDSLTYCDGVDFKTYDTFIPDPHAFCLHPINGAWWYNPEDCFVSNLNGPYGPSQTGGIYWETWKGQDHILSAVTIKIRK